MTLKNILFFCPREVNVTMGGIERVTDSLARHLIKNGYNIVFMSVEHTCDREYDCTAPQYFTKSSGNEQWILEVIRKHNINVVINQMGFFSYCPKKALPKETKVITVMHDSYYAMYPRLKMNVLRKWHWKHVMCQSLKSSYVQSDKIVLFTAAFKEEYRFFYHNAENSKFVIIPNFNTYANVCVQPKEKRIIWVGRHAEWHKRTKDMLLVWSLLETDFPDWTLDILGNGPDGEVIKQLHKDLKLKRCILHGVQDPKPFYEKASIICMTSSFESFGMVLTEGMQHGCVPIAYDSYTAIRYIIHNGEDGILVAPFDIDEYANKLGRLMMNGEELSRLSVAARESVKQYDAINIVPKWIEMIESL